MTEPMDLKDVDDNDLREIAHLWGFANLRRMTYGGGLLYDTGTAVLAQAGIWILAALVWSSVFMASGGVIFFSYHPVCLVILLLSQLFSTSMPPTDINPARQFGRHSAPHTSDPCPPANLHKRPEDHRDSRSLRSEPPRCLCSHRRPYHHRDEQRRPPEVYVRTWAYGSGHLYLDLQSSTSWLPTVLRSERVRFGRQGEERLQVSQDEWVCYTYAGPSNDLCCDIYGFQ